MEEKIALFLYRFSRLKHEINNSPRNLSWLANEREDLQELCYELDGSYNSIAKLLATKKSKHTFITVPFENEWKVYELSYRNNVKKAAEPIKEHYLMELKKSLQDGETSWVKSEKTKEEYWKFVNEFIPAGSSFNPLVDNPASLMEGIRDYLEYSVANDLHEEELNDKALGAWYFFEKSIGLDYDGIYKRWSNSPELFIPPNIQQTNTIPLIELYNEAVKTYVFGHRISSVVMCRALMEHILKKYYRVHAEKLIKIIAIAEQKFPQLTKWDMQKKRKTANDILHDYENKDVIKDEAVINFLKTIKNLVQNVPKKA